MNKGTKMSSKVGNFPASISMTTDDMMLYSVPEIPSAIKKRLEIPKVPKRSKHNQLLKTRIYKRKIISTYTLNTANKAILINKKEI